MATPLLNIIWIRKSKAETPDWPALRAWLEQQTCASFLECVVWDRTTGTAQPLSEPDRLWPAPDGRALLAGLPCRYICVAGDDLLRQHETYLEENLTALQYGALAFTVNLRGQADWAWPLVRNGRLPGNCVSPLMRQVVRRDCLNRDLGLDLSGWIQARKGFPSVAGRIVHHLTNLADPPESMPFEGEIVGMDAESRVEGMNILVAAQVPKEWSAPFAGRHPVDSVLSGLEPPSKLPTAIMVHTYLAVGGAERIHLNIMRELKDKIRFMVLGIEPLDPALGTTADEFRQLTPFVYTLPDFLNPSMNLSFLCGLIGRSRPAALYIANGANVIYDHLPEVKHRFPELRIVNQVYDHHIGWINRYNPAVVASLDGHIAVNRKICQAYREKGAPAEEIHLIENGIIPQEFDAPAYDHARVESIKRELGLPGGRKIVTFAARMHPQKRPLDFVELADRFVPDPSVIFLMIGDGPEAEEVSRMVAGKGLRNLYRRPFYRPMSDIYALTDVYVLPSVFEGMPMVLIEAQVMGKPVVVTDVGNNREVLDFTGGGVVIGEVGDVTALKNGVRQMLESPPDPQKLRETVLSRYDIGIVAENYRRVLLDLKPA
jgi:glycosyltransferase involved in cell wall biosynthesis